jgi:hypothetical protein
MVFATCGFKTGKRRVPRKKKSYRFKADDHRVPQHKPATIAKAVRMSRPPRNAAKAYNEYLLNACRSGIDWDANAREARRATLLDELESLK